MKTYNDVLMDKVIERNNKPETLKELTEPLDLIANHKRICERLNKVYADKNHDYGNSFGETYEKLGAISAVTRISDKTSRLQSLVTKDEQRVDDERLIDTALDLANYAIMFAMELEETEVKNKAELKSWFEDDKLYVGEYVKHKINQLDEPEVKQLYEKISELESYNDELIRDNNQLRNEIDNQEVLSQEFIDKYKVDYDNWMPAVPIVHLQNLLVPRQEELEVKIQELIEVYKQEDGAYSNPENGWIGGFIEDLKNLLEEEQKYYAKIKGHENIYSDICFWIYDTEIEELLIDNAEIYPDVTAGYMIKATKDEWASLGINDDNADFVKVEEMEEC